MIWQTDTIRTDSAPGAPSPHSIQIDEQLLQFVEQLALPQAHSHKGQNGKALIIGGSDLFHAASRWSFLAASRIVDMTFYSSVAENNQLLYDAKFYAHDGVVVPRRDLASYIQEAGSILIGPGMRRDFATRFSDEELENVQASDLTESDWENDTQAVTRVLTRMAPDKKWVIDAGALQVIQPRWLPQKAVLTPHPQELLQFSEKISPDWKDWFETFLADERSRLYSLVEAEQFGFSHSPRIWTDTATLLDQRVRAELHAFSQALNGATFLLKGAVDIVWNETQLVLISGGNAGMTKGGSGDVLSGSLLGFLATSEQFPSAVVASALNKLAGHLLYQKNDIMFNSSDLVDTLPEAWKRIGLRARP